MTDLVTRQSDRAAAVPLIERLHAVPADAVLRINTPNPLGMDTRSMPIGILCTEAADEIERLQVALLTCARQAEALKRDCGTDPESAQAVRNAQYQAISTTAHLALGTIGRTGHV